MRFSFSDKIADSDKQSTDNLCDRHSSARKASEGGSVEDGAPSVPPEISPPPIDGNANDGENGDLRPRRSSHRMRTVPVDEDDAEQAEESSAEGAAARMLSARRAQVVISASGVY